MAGSFETRREVSGSDGVGNTRSLLGLVWQKLIPRRGGSLFRKRNIELHTHESFASFVKTIRDSVRNANIPALENTFEFDLWDISLAADSSIRRESNIYISPSEKKKYENY